MERVVLTLSLFTLLVLIFHLLYIHFLHGFCFFFNRATLSGHICYILRICLIRAQNVKSDITIKSVIIKLVGKELFDYVVAPVSMVQTAVPGFLVKNFQ